MYAEEIVQPMRAEVVQAGFQEVRTAAEVDAALNSVPTAIFFVNSVCGCSAGVARPGVASSVQAGIKPVGLFTAFAGNDKEAVNRIREHMVGFPPSSPCAGVFRDGELVYMLERHQIEGNSAENVSKMLSSAYARYCGEEINLDIKIWDPLSDFLIEPTEFAALAQQDGVWLLDLREESEKSGAEFPNALAVTNELANEIVNSWPRERKIVALCRMGGRSLQAVQFLRQQGFDQSWCVRGGTSAL
jgi:putative YphP/YqiW family bacilliredoxin